MGHSPIRNFSLSMGVPGRNTGVDTFLLTQGVDAAGVFTVNYRRPVLLATGYDMENDTPTNQISTKQSLNLTAPSPMPI